MITPPEMDSISPQATNRIVHKSIISKYSIMSVLEFLGTPLGIISVGVVSSIAGNALYKCAVNLYNKADTKVKHKRLIKRMISAGELYCSGYTAAYAKYKSTFHQTLHINRFTIKLLMEILRIILVSFAALAFLVVLQEFIIVRPIIIAIASVLIAILYQRVKALINSYQLMYDNEFGEEYKKRMKEGMEQHWGKMIEKKDETNSKK